MVEFPLNEMFHLEIFKVFFIALILACIFGWNIFFMSLWSVLAQSTKQLFIPYDYIIETNYFCIMTRCSWMIGISQDFHNYLNIFFTTIFTVLCRNKYLMRQTIQIILECTKTSNFCRSFKTILTSLGRTQLKDYSGWFIYS